MCWRDVAALTCVAFRVRMRDVCGRGVENECGVELDESGEEAKEGNEVFRGREDSESGKQ